MPFENPPDVWRKIAFDAMNATLNYENFKPRVSLEHWFADPHPERAEIDELYRVGGHSGIRLQQIGRRGRD